MDPTIDHGPTRRTVLRTAAWSIPVVAVTVATPLAAASIGAMGVTMFPGSSLFLNEGGMNAALMWPGATVTNPLPTSTPFDWVLSVQALSGTTVLASGSASAPGSGSYAIPSPDLLSTGPYFDVWDGISATIPPVLVTIRITTAAGDVEDTVTLAV